MAVLVTGAAGFIGSHLVDRLLASGEEVVGLDAFDDFYPRGIKEANLREARDHATFTLVEGDIRDDVLVARLPDRIDAIVHLAARAGVRPSIERPVLYADVNLRGTSVLLDLAARRGIRPFVFASSSSVYGNAPTVPFSESFPVDHPISPYAATKKGGELLCHSAVHLHGLRCIALRFFTVYGPRQRPDLAIRKFARLLLEGAEIPRFGDGGSARDYTWVDDILGGIRASLDWCRAAEPAAFEVVNLGESEPIPLERMIGTLAAALERTPRIRALPPQPGDVERTWADLAHARRVLGYEPSTPFEEGIARFVEWYLAEGAAQDGVTPGR